jgi:hypothetical protein
MEAIMKKKLLMALAVVMGTSSMLPLVASTESMYQDIMGSIVNNSLVQNDEQRLVQLNRSLEQVYSQKRNAEEFLIWTHGRMRADLAMVGTLSAGMSAFVPVSSYVFQNMTMLDTVSFTTIFGALSVLCFSEKYVTCYFAKKNLVELNEVIAKLETAKTELEQKVTTQQA